MITWGIVCEFCVCVSVQRHMAAEFGLSFDRWYPDMIWHCWCTRKLLVVHCNAFVMFEHVPLLTLAFDFASGGMLPCLMPVYSYMFDRWNPDMIWHVYVLPGDLLPCFGMFMLPCLISVYLYVWQVFSWWDAGKRWHKLSAKMLRVSMFWNVMVGITRSKVYFFAKINIWTWKLIWSHQEFSWRSARIFFPKLTWISGSFFALCVPKVSKRLTCKSETNIEKECVVYPDTLTSFNPSKLTSFWLLNDLFLFIGCSWRTSHSLNCFHVSICKGKISGCFSLKYYKKEI